MNPPLAPAHKGMKVDYRGLLRQTRVALPLPDASDKIFMLEALQDHLTELGERFYAGDLAVVDEFLQLYCIASDKRPAGVASAQSPSMSEVLAAALDALDDNDVQAATVILKTAQRNAGVTRSSEQSK